MDKSCTVIALAHAIHVRLAVDVVHLAFTESKSSINIPTPVGMNQGMNTQPTCSN